MTITTKIIAAIMMAVAMYMCASAVVSAFDERAELRTQYGAAQTKIQAQGEEIVRLTAAAEAERDLDEKLQIGLDTTFRKIDKELSHATRNLYEFRHTAPPDVQWCLDLVVPDDVFVRADQAGPATGNQGGAGEGAGKLPAAPAGTGVAGPNRVQQAGAKAGVPGRTPTR